MAEEKKPKIDLKARLGKTMVGVGAPPPPAGGVVPPPAPGSVPPPAGATPLPAPTPAASGGRVSVPPPAASPGIPAPPFAQPRASAPIDNPFAPKPAAAAPAPPPKPAEIKLEVGAEAAEAAKAKNKLIVLAGVAGVVGGVLIGSLIGKGMQVKSDDQSARDGAGLLAKDVEASNAKIKELAEKIKTAGESIKAKKFPDNFATELGGLNIPFDGEKLSGRGIGKYDSKTLTALFQYTADVSALNARKDALKSLFTSQKAAIVSQLESAETPKVGYTIIITKAEKGPVASLAPIKDPFKLQGDWPKEFTMQNLVSRQEQKVNRFETGEPFSTKDKQFGVPLEPMSVGAAFPNDVSSRIQSEIAKTVQLLAGVQAATPDDEDKPGLIKNGEALVAGLKKISGGK